MLISQDQKGAWQKKEVPGVSEFIPTGTKGPGKSGGSSLEVMERGDGRDIKASMSAGNDVFDKLTLGTIKAPMAGFDLTIKEDKQGNATVEGAHTRFPSFEVWQYGKGEPKLLYHYDANKAKTSAFDIGDPRIPINRQNPAMYIRP
jgi:hypothetical protein